jgi:DNA polymerase-3 subunit alpha
MASLPAAVSTNREAQRALIAFQTAYLKANHPVEYMAACSAVGNTKARHVIEGYRRMNISVLPPTSAW